MSINLLHLLFGTFFASVFAVLFFLILLVFCIPPEDYSRCRILAVLIWIRNGTSSVGDSSWAERRRRKRQRKEPASPGELSILEEEGIFSRGGEEEEEEQEVGANNDDNNSSSKGDRGRGGSGCVRERNSNAMAANNEHRQMSAPESPCKEQRRRRQLKRTLNRRPDNGYVPHPV